MHTNNVAGKIMQIKGMKQKHVAQYTPIPELSLEILLAKREFRRTGTQSRANQRKNKAME